MKNDFGFIFAYLTANVAPITPDPDNSILRVGDNAVGYNPNTGLGIGGKITRIWLRKSKESKQAIAVEKAWRNDEERLVVEISDDFVMGKFNGENVIKFKN